MTGKQKLLLWTLILGSVGELAAVTILGWKAFVGFVGGILLAAGIAIVSYLIVDQEEIETEPPADWFTPGRDDD